MSFLDSYRLVLQLANATGCTAKILNGITRLQGNYIYAP